MTTWFDNPEACYVLAAYGVAAAGLLGLALVSWRQWRRVQRAWREAQARRQSGP